MTAFVWANVFVEMDPDSLVTSASEQAVIDDRSEVGIPQVVTVSNLAGTRIFTLHADWLVDRINRSCSTPSSPVMSCKPSRRTPCWLSW